jgi:hypothetical protein
MPALEGHRLVALLVTRDVGPDLDVEAVERLLEIRPLGQNRRKDLLFARRGMEPGGLLVAKNRGGWFAVSRVLKDSTLVDFADVTGDKRPDVVTSFGSTGTVVVYRRLPNGGFAGPRTYTLTYPFQSAAGVGDVTGDGRNDVVLTTSESWPGAHLLVMAQNGSGTLNPPVSQPAVQDPGADRARHES